MNRQYNKDRYDSWSIPGYVIRKNQSRGPLHGQTRRQIMYHKARDMQRKANVPKNGSCEKDGTEMQTIQSRHLLKVGQKRKIQEYDALALPIRQHLKTGDDRQRNWKIVFNKEGVQAPIRQQPDFREAKRACCRLYKEHVTGQGNQSIHPPQQRRQHPQQQCEGHEEYASSSQWQQNDELKSNQSWDYWRSSTETEQ